MDAGSVLQGDGMLAMQGFLGCMKLRFWLPNYRFWLFIYTTPPPPPFNGKECSSRKNNSRACWPGLWMLQCLLWLGMASQHAYQRFLFWPPCLSLAWILVQRFVLKHAPYVSPTVPPHESTAGNPPSLLLPSSYQIWFYQPTCQFLRHLKDTALSLINQK